MLRCAVAAVGLAASLAVAEGAVRAFALAPPLVKQWEMDPHGDPHLPFRPPPHLHVKGRNYTDEFDFDYTYNSMGFRDVEHDWHKPEGVYRILGLGDSFTHGAGADFDQCYLNRLEAMLNERPGRHPRVEIIKAGIGRYYPETERILLEHYGLRYQPDLVLVGFLPNDVWDTHLGIESVTTDESGYLVSKEAQHLGRWARDLYLRSHLCRLVLRAYADWRNGRRYDLVPDDIYREGGAHEDDWLRIEAEYERMIDLCRPAGAAFAVIHIPQAGPWRPEHGYPGERLTAWAARSGAVCIDALPAMQRVAADGAGLHYPKDGHCTPAGYAVVADAAFRVLASIVP